MDKFEEAWKANRHVWESTKNLAKAMYLAGEEAQQAKVEELEYRIKCEREISLFADKLCCELQKRVDKALKIHDEFDDQDDVRLMMYAVEQALKGEANIKKIPDIYGRCDPKPDPLKLSEIEK
ncbi:hypothetical protein KWF57_18545 [Acinetobacter baumannii]